MFNWLTGSDNADNNSNNNNNNQNNNRRNSSAVPATQVVKRKTTKTGMTASKQKNKRLKTRKEIEKMKSKLPKDFQMISEGTFAEMSKITDQVFLTGIFGLSRENFSNNNITNVINATYEAPDIDIKGISYMRVLADDDLEEDLTPYLNPVADNIERMAREGRNTVVHCVAGVSRSTALVLAYLMKYKDMSLKQAFRHVFDRRKVVKPIKGFYKQLIAYEKKIRGNNSCQLITYKSHKYGVSVVVPDFYPKHYPQLLNLELELERQRQSDSMANVSSKMESNISSYIDESDSQ